MAVWIVRVDGPHLAPHLLASLGNDNHVAATVVFTWLAPDLTGLFNSVDETGHVVRR